MNDLALGAIVLVWAAVPASLLILALADVVKLEGEGRRKRWIRACLFALTPPVLVVSASFAWGWAGAAHLEPLCSAYAEPEIRNERPLPMRVLAVDSDRMSETGSLPEWAETLTRPQGPFDTVIVADERGESGEALLLEVRRITHHRNRLFHVQMDRFRLVDPRFDTTLAVGDELWIDAGRARYHCGIGSGRYPTQESRYSRGEGVANFLRQALAGRR